MGSCQQGTVRLVQGATSREGTVEICVNGFWGTICSNLWDSRDAQVVCHQLGYTVLGMCIHFYDGIYTLYTWRFCLCLHYDIITGPIPIRDSQSHFGYTTGTTRPILLDFLSCFGNETNLLNCTQNNTGVVSSCDAYSSNEVGVICPGVPYIIPLYIP